MEIILVFSTIIIISAIMINLSIEELDTSFKTKEKIETRQLIEKITQTINTAYTNQESHIKIITLPEKLENKTYTAIINKTGIYINTYNHITYKKPIPNNIKNSYNQTTIYLIPGKTYKIENKKEETTTSIIITQI